MRLDSNLMFSQSVLKKEPQDYSNVEMKSVS
jgi:hypothetical protein